MSTLETGAAAAAHPTAQADIAAAADAPPMVAVRQTQRLNGARRVLAQRMVQSMQTAPHFYAAMDVDMSQVQAARQRAKAAGQPAATVNDHCLAAAAQALRAVPALNSTLDGEQLTLWADVNIGIAMAVGDKLLVPVVRHADRLAPAEIAGHSAALAARAQQKKLLPAECEGATFSVSNLGMFGVRHFTAIIPPGQAAILAVGAVQPRPVAQGDDGAGAVAVRPMATMTLSVDHRIADGVTAARFLDALRQALETPDAPQASGAPQASDAAKASGAQGAQGAPKALAAPQAPQASASGGAHG